MYIYITIEATILTFESLEVDENGVEQPFYGEIIWIRLKNENVINNYDIWMCMNMGYTQIYGNIDRKHDETVFQTNPYLLFLRYFSTFCFTFINLFLSN